MMQPNKRYTLPFKETYRASIKPHCGWYYITAIDFTAPSIYTGPALFENHATSLELIEICLKAYRNKDLDEVALNIIEEVFASCHQLNKQMIVRFTYDVEGLGLSNEPSSLSRILAHITQLSSVVQSYKEDIFVLQGLFVGSWGEMHQSKFLDQYSLMAIFDAMKTAFGEDFYYAVRTPKLLRLFNHPHVGLFDDGLLAGEDDLGTFEDFSKELKEVHHVSLSSPIGGETSCLSDRCDIILTDDYFRNLGLSYLNRGYQLDVLNHWQKQEIHHQNGLDYLTYKMGYDFHLKKIQALLTQSGELQLKLTLKNEGYAPAYYPYDVYLYLNDSRYKIHVDLRKVPQTCHFILNAPLNTTLEKLVFEIKYQEDCILRYETTF